MLKFTKLLLTLSFLFTLTTTYSQKPKFNVIALYTGKNDPAHVNFVNEANKWFPEMAKKYQFA